MVSLLRAFAGFLKGLAFRPAEGGGMFFRNTGPCPAYTELQPRRLLTGMRFFVGTERTREHGSLHHSTRLPGSHGNWRAER
jgi:hypothetical protein